MFNVILFEPEIPPNTGNIIRLCANTGAQLHLIRPLGFDLDDRNLRRAGLDYHEYATMQVHDSLAACLKSLPQARLFAFTTKASRPYHEVKFQAGDAFLFGPESRGLPLEVLESISPERRLRLPMLPDNRSLNLSNTVAVVVFEAWRQCGFEGGSTGSADVPVGLDRQPADEDVPKAGNPLSSKLDVELTLGVPTQPTNSLPG